MCLAIPAKIEKREGDEAWVRMGDARMRVNVMMTPDVKVDDWILVHAGFSIQEVDEETALETWDLIEQIPEDEEREVMS
jgi:hydrogenase expression/formation protein HypC